MQDHAATLRFAVLPRSGLLTDAILVAGGAGLVGLAAQVSFHLGYTPIPITLQTFPVLLVGAALGTVRGAASLALYLLLGMAGVPLYADHNHGWNTFSGATGGYIVGFVVAAALIGWLSERGWDRRFSSSVAAMLSGSVVIYIFGALWLRHSLHLNWANTLEDGVYPFVPFDLLKVYLAAATLPSAWALVRRLRS
ncbi:MAG TPA: biotin transporter BioY [Gaiellaceae bacterium]|jgi:biotin transport system substrate-specific component|nr:biotin transporter BioY [Gaiellaceae bacterium]